MSFAAADRARGVIESFSGRRVLVVGDAMVDRFVWGEVDRISPEAPVPVVRVERESDRPGGAANVAANLASLGAAALLAAAVGTDEAAAALRALLESEGIEPLLVPEASRATPLKTRVIARSQQVVRVDRESAQPVSERTRAELEALVLGALPRVDAVVISDYDKGVVGPELLRAVLPRARQAGLPVVVDPKPRNFLHYEPATVVAPNQREAASLAGAEIRTDGECLEAARAVLERLDVRSVLVTRGPQGMLLLERDREPRWIPTAAQEVFDVTGAGDTVAAVVALGVAAGASLREAAELANYAAGIVVGKVGTATVSPHELLARVGIKT